MLEECKKLTHDEKKSVFATTEAPEAINLRSFMQPEASFKAQVIAAQKCSFFIDGDIASKIIVDLLTALARIESGDAEVEGYPDESANSASISSLALLDGKNGNSSSDELADRDHFAMLEKKRVLKMFEYNPEDDMSN